MYRDDLKRNLRWGIENFGASCWLWFGKYVIRVGKPWCRYKYAWRPLLSAFRAYR